MADDLITAQQLIDRYDGGAEALREYAGTVIDGDAAVYDPDKVAAAIAGASDEAYGILLGGFETNERVQALAANDVEVLDALALLVRYRLTRFKKEFRRPDTGMSIFLGDAREARDALRMKSDGAKRTSAEKAVNGPGESELLRPRGSHRIRSAITDDGTPRGF